MGSESPYRHAVGECVPKVFKDLTRTGRLEEHLQEKSKQTRQMFNALTAPKLPNGLPEPPHWRQAEEQVFATVIGFPDEGPQPWKADSLGSPKVP